MPSVREPKRVSRAERAEGARQFKEELALFAESPRPQLINPLRLISDDAVALFDIHMPFVDAAFCSRVVSLALSWNIETCIIGGDLTDQSVWSKWGADPEETMEEELATTEAFLSVLSSQFKNILWFMGNHESRLLGKVLDRQLRVERFLRLITPPGVTNISVTPFEWMEQDSCSGVWLWAHPKNASVIAGRVPTMIAGRSCQGKHVVSGHGHLAAMLRNESDTHFCIDSGMCADPDRLSYHVMAKGTRPKMMQGAVLLKSGFPTLVMPCSDWGAETRKYAGVPPCKTEVIKLSS